MNSRLPMPAEQYLKSLEDFLLSLKPKAKQELFQAVVDAPFKDQLEITNFDLGITVLLLKNNKAGMVDRIALSKTKMAEGAVKMSAKPFKSIRIPADNQQNIINKAISTGKLQKTSNWHDLFVPELTQQQAAFNQSGAGIECSLVCKLGIKDGGAMIFSFYQPLENLDKVHYLFARRYSKLAEKTLNTNLKLF